MQDNLRKKWQVTNEELKAAQDELCAKGVGKGYYQNTNALLALLDVMTAGDIPAQVENDEAAHARTGENAPASEKPKKRLKITVEDFDDGEVQEFETQAMVLYLADDHEENGVEVRTVRNLRGIMRSCAIAMRLEEEPQQIMENLLKFEKEGGVQ